MKCNETNEINELQHNANLLKFSNFMQLYYLPAIVFIGIIGNILTILVISTQNKLLNTFTSMPLKRSSKHAIRKHNNCSTRDTFVLCLAISDLIYNMILACVWLSYMGIYDLVNKNYFCKLSVTVTYICSFLSSSFILLFTFQRFMGIARPLKVLPYFYLESPRFVRSLIFKLSIISIFIYGFTLFLYDNSLKVEYCGKEAKHVCGIKERYAHVVYLFDNSLDCFLTLIVPAVGISFMNCFISRSFKNWKKIVYCNKSDLLRPNMVTQGSRSINNNDKKKQIVIYTSKYSSKSVNKITKMLLIVSSVFILLNSPYRISKLISFCRMSITNNYVYSDFEYAINVVLINLYFTSYSVNFFLYCMCGSKYRDTLKEILRLCFSLENQEKYIREWYQSKNLIKRSLSI